jgi:hypothetical protein
MLSLLERITHYLSHLKIFLMVGEKDCIYFSDEIVGGYDNVMNNLKTRRIESI